MTDAKNKHHAEAESTQRTGNMTVGEVLKQARLQKRLGLEEVSSAIHVRVAQLRAIEEGNIDQLPGMTYAIGFVKSYAGFLKLNPIDISNRFKAEHGAMKPVMPDLQAPQPLVESRMPDPMLIGVAAFCAILVLVAWSLLSGGDDEEIADAGLAAPTVIAEASPEGSAPVLTDGVVAADNAVPPSDVGLTTLPADTAAAAATAPATPAATSATDLPATALADTATAAAAVPAADAAVAAGDAPPAPPAAPAGLAAVDAAAVSETTVAATDSAAEPVLLPAEKPVPVTEETPDEVINIRKPGRVVLKARQPSWVQVMDNRGNIVYKRVMRPGEQYAVPDARGMTLITSNAGGFDVTVDGKKMAPLGKSGEILRGVQLAPEALKQRRPSNRLNN